MRFFLSVPFAVACFCLGGAFLAMANPASAGAQNNPLGATASSGGVVFRVWAPYAKSVSVSVNDGPAVPMALEGGHDTPPDMVWTARVAGANAGDRYRYLIDSGSGAQSFVDPYAEQLAGYDNTAQSIVVDPKPLDDGFRMAPMNKLVIYELHVGTFNPDSSGNYTFAGAAGKLDYLMALGVNAVEVMPIDLNSTGYHDPPAFNWGYDGMHLFAINPSYGTPADFIAFVRACHEHGIAVIVDVVYNHLVRRNLLERFGGYSSASYPDGIYFTGPTPGPTPWGPRPNFDSPQVRQYVLDNALHWFREYGVDGERWDSVDNIYAYTPAGAKEPVPLAGGRQLLTDFNHARPPHKLAIAEDLSLYPPTTESLAGGGMGFDCRWNNWLGDSLRAVVSAPSDSARDLNAIAKALDITAGDGPFRKVVYTENHDTVGHPPWQTRFPVSINPADPGSDKARRLSTLASAILLTAPGIPLLFQGQEMLDPRPFDFGNATYVNWKLAQDNSVIEGVYRELIALRLNKSGHTEGLTQDNFDLFHVDNQAKTLAYRRYGEGKPDGGVIVVANFSSRPIKSLKIGFPRAGKWQVRLDTAAALSAKGSPSLRAAITAEPDPMEGLPCSGVASLAPYSALILSQ